DPQVEQDPGASHLDQGGIAAGTAREHGKLDGHRSGSSPGPILTGDARVHSGPIPVYGSRMPGASRATGASRAGQTGKKTLATGVPWYTILQRPKPRFGRSRGDRGRAVFPGGTRGAGLSVVASAGASQARGVAGHADPARRVPAARPEPGLPAGPG